PESSGGCARPATHEKIARFVCHAHVLVGMLRHRETCPRVRGHGTQQVRKANCQASHLLGLLVGCGLGAISHAVRHAVSTFLYPMSSSIFSMSFRCPAP